MANNRHTATFLLLLVLAAIITLQILAMVRSDRLSKRLNKIVDIWTDAVTAGRQTSGPGRTTVGEDPGELGVGELADFVGSGLTQGEVVGQSDERLEVCDGLFCLVQSFVGKSAVEVRQSQVRIQLQGLVAVGN